MNPLDPRSVERLARLAYEEYGHRLPWSTVSKDRRRRWCAAAKLIILDMMG